MKSFQFKNIHLVYASARKSAAVFRTDFQAIRKPRGAALIMAMLVTLVLSGLGLIAMHSVNETAWKTANYRSRQQASQVSDAVANLAVYRLGDAGNSYISSMHKALNKEMGSMPADATGKAKSALLSRGPYMIFSSNVDDENINENAHSINYLFTGQDSANDNAEIVGGIFDDAVKGSEIPSFSANSNTNSLNVKYRFIIRDELDGPPATGFDRDHCFKKITIASHSRVAPTQSGDAGWRSRTNIATNRNMVEAMVGPIPCGEK